MTYFIHESLNKLDLHAQQLSRKIMRKYGRPSNIMYIQRGGMVVARLLSDYLMVREMHCINTSFYGWSKSKPTSKVSILQIPKLRKTKSYTLLVDDIADTGSTIKAVVDRLKKVSKEKLVVATVAYKERSKFTPDVYCFKAPSDGWVLFGYERTEMKSVK